MLLRLNGSKYLQPGSDIWCKTRNQRSGGGYMSVYMYIYGVYIFFAIWCTLCVISSHTFVLELVAKFSFSANQSRSHQISNAKFCIIFCWTTDLNPMQLFCICSVNNKTFSWPCADAETQLLDIPCHIDQSQRTKLKQRIKE